VRLVLAIDTSTAETAVGLGLYPYAPEGEPEVVGEVNVATPRAALTHVFPIVAHLLAECGHAARDIGAVIVGRGPGSFTGVRIGVAAAKGLAQGLGVPLWGVGTLDAVAERFAEREGLVGVVGDAMRREVYPALFRCAGGTIERLGPDRVVPPAEAAGEWARATDGPLLLVGDGMAKYADVFMAALGDRAEVAPSATWAPTGAGLLQAAWRGGAPWSGDVAGSVLPVYTRLSDAEEVERCRAAAAGSAPAAPPGVDGAVPASGVAGPGDDDSGRRPGRGDHT
jgi:N6-L-threonylcarbamoyladenine synthase/protein kinase Bud32